MSDCRYLADEIWTVSKFLSLAECDAFIRRAESEGFDEAPINTPMGPQLRKDIRNNTRIMLDDPSLAKGMALKIQDYVSLRIGRWSFCGVNERFRFYRYDVGQQFDWHYDGYFERANGERSRLTFMIYLNDDFTGGETAFEHAEVAPEKGMALFFHHDILHKGKPVASGRKYVLRTDVMYRRQSD